LGERLIKGGAKKIFVPLSRKFKIKGLCVKTHPFKEYAYIIGEENTQPEGGVFKQKG